MNYEELLNEEIEIAWHDIEQSRLRIEQHLLLPYIVRRADERAWHRLLWRMLERQADLRHEHGELLRERDERERGWA